MSMKFFDELSQNFLLKKEYNVIEVDKKNNKNLLPCYRSYLDKELENATSNETFSFNQLIFKINKFKNSEKFCNNIIAISKNPKDFKSLQELALVLVSTVFLKNPLYFTGLLNGNEEYNVIIEVDKEANKKSFTAHPAI
ncbi:hypothetical protein Glove_421g78 [Diversispora epigaea]|uniref:Uncharacterized protein n=1 Tax=Diversispora epigaea TaxID=1348612 RepID=A0A397GVF9_9GLOM|nr:hypothetical protein Glove_421g78 [Diversispora epigaea]